MKRSYHVNVYVIERDHSNETKFFRVYVPEAGHRGYGFQVRLGKHVVGLSVYVNDGPPHRAG